MSPGLAAMTAKGGAAVPFPGRRTAGGPGRRRLTAKRVERAAEASGAALAAASRTAAALVARRKLAPLPPSPLPDKLYAIIDGTSVPVEAVQPSPAVRHALDRQRRRLHHHPALRRGQQPVGSHLPQPSQPDRSRLTGTRRT